MAGTPAEMTRSNLVVQCTKYCPTVSLILITQLDVLAESLPTPTPGSLAILCLNKPVCLVRLDTEQVFTEKDITYYDFIIVPTCFCSLNICG